MLKVYLHFKKYENNDSFATSAAGNMRRAPSFAKD